MLIFLENKIQRMLAELPAKRNDRKTTSPVHQKHPPGKSKRIQKLLRNAKNQAGKQEPNNIKQFFKVSKKGVSGKKSDSSVASDSTNNDHSKKVLRSTKKSVSNAEADTNNRISAIKQTNITQTNKISGKRKCNKFMLNKNENTKLEESEAIIDNVQLSEDLNSKELDVTVDNDFSLSKNDGNSSTEKIDANENTPVKFENTHANEENYAKINEKTPLDESSEHTDKITTTPSAPKKKVKKLNDCIARLTCKIQEKLGVSFFESKCDLLTASQAEEADEVLDLSCKKAVDVQEKAIDATISTLDKTEALDVNVKALESHVEVIIEPVKVEENNEPILEIESKCTKYIVNEPEIISEICNNDTNLNLKLNVVIEPQETLESIVKDEDAIPLIEFLNKPDEV